MLGTEHFETFQKLATLEERTFRYITFHDMDGLKQLLRDSSYDEIFTKRFSVGNKYELLDTARMTDLARKDLLLPYNPIVIRCKRHEVNNLPCVYILYALKGSFTCEIAGEHLELQEGETCMCNAGVSNYFEGNQSDSMCITIALTKWYISSTLMHRIPHNSVFGNFFEHGVFSTGLSEPYIYISTEASEKLRFFMTEACWEFLNNGVQEIETINAYIVLFFNELIRIYEQTCTLLSENGRVNVAEIINYIYENYADISLSSMAEHFHFNSNYLSGIVKKIMGKNFTDLVLEIRMNNACRLLRETAMSITDIAQQVGYQNVNHFYRLFKAAYGCTPAEYRKRYIS